MKALKQLKFHKAPHVLAIHLKHFSVVGSGGKIDKKIDFGCTLDLKPFVSSSHVSSPYNIIFQWITFSVESNNIVFLISTGFLIKFAHLNDILVSMSIDQSQEGNFKYTLYGVLVHDGWSTHFGHYFYFIHSSMGIWHALDDNRVYICYSCEDMFNFVEQAHYNLCITEYTKKLQFYVKPFLYMVRLIILKLLRLIEVILMTFCTLGLLSQ